MLGSSAAICRDGRADRHQIGRLAGRAPTIDRLDGVVGSAGVAAAANT
jgi:hypothetical protein